MRRHATTILLAAAITVLSVLGDYALIHDIGPRWLALIAFAPAMPAFFGSFPFGGGPEGNPGDPGVLVFSVTFVLWAAVIEGIAAWRRRPR